eukprot:CAMPEP_0197036248 /NCGR_PEP_ID=MMETSP1384-20130603/13817_1 /TAXON_ID=29189 /ORGANISM="Ammonia sp." /LENGTH=376 /DNA_ID=CAMNT_0042466409 /DNA_START=29 /DNA_END=1159 /DNA_ORIENTATION=+
MAFNQRQLAALQQYFAANADKDEGLVSFRAGRLFLDSSTKMVTADTKRGKIKLVKDETGILKFQWYNRISNQKELDLMIMPHCATWQKVDECKDGRVFLLKMTDSNRKHFFWMQEPKEEKDEEYSTKIGKLIRGESLGDDASSTNANTASSAANPYGAFGGLGMGQQQNAGGGQNAMAQLLLSALQGQGGNNNASGSNNAAAATNNNAAQQQPAQLGQDLLAAMNMMQQQQVQERLEEMKREPDLEDILDPNANQEILALLDDEKMVEQLAEHLPESMRSRQDIVEQLQSPQFQGALRRLQSAIQGPQMPTILSQMGINPPSENAMGVTAFVNAIQPNNDKKDDKGKQDDDGDSAMQNKDDKDKEKEKDKKDGNDK